MKDAIKTWHPALRSYVSLWLLVAIAIVVQIDPALPARWVNAEGVMAWMQAHPNTTDWLSHGAGAIGMLAFLQIAVSHFSQAIHLTPHLLVYERRVLGLYRASSTSVPLESIRKVEPILGLRHAVMGVGHLRIASAGTGESEIEMGDVLHPLRIQKQIYQHARQAKSRSSAPAVPKEA